MILRPKLVNPVRTTWGAKTSSIKAGKTLYFLKSYDFYHKEDQNLQIGEKFVAWKHLNFRHFRWSALLFREKEWWENVKPAISTLSWLLWIFLPCCRDINIPNSFIVTKCNLCLNLSFKNKHKTLQGKQLAQWKTSACTGWAAHYYLDYIHKHTIKLRKTLKRSLCTCVLVKLKSF